MLAKNRRRAIIDALQKNGIIMVGDIVSAFDVSYETARRDLEVLQEQHAVRRIFGGAVLPEPPSEPDPPEQPPAAAGSHHGTYTAVARAAAALIHDGETVMLSVGTTMCEMARHLKTRTGVRILTNSLPIIQELIETPNEVYCLGGRVDPIKSQMVGKNTLQSVQNYYVDKTFISASRVTVDDGISVDTDADAGVNNAMLSRARKKILVVNSEKFSSNSFVIQCPITDVDMIVTDSRLDPDTAGRITELGIELILTEPDET